MRSGAWLAALRHTPPLCGRRGLTCAMSSPIELSSSSMRLPISSMRPMIWSDMVANRPCCATEERRVARGVRAHGEQLAPGRACARRGRTRAATICVSRFCTNVVSSCVDCRLLGSNSAAGCSSDACVVFLGGGHRRCASGWCGQRLARATPRVAGRALVEASTPPAAPTRSRSLSGPHHSVESGGVVLNQRPPRTPTRVDARWPPRTRTGSSRACSSSSRRRRGRSP